MTDQHLRRTMSRSFPLDFDEHDDFGAGPGTTFGDDRCFVFLPDSLVDELGCPERVVITITVQPVTDGGDV